MFKTAHIIFQFSTIFVVGECYHHCY